MKEYDITDERLRKMERLLLRLEEIDKEIEAVDEQAWGNLKAGCVARLIEKKNHLRIEKQNIERRLKEMYKVTIR